MTAAPRDPAPAPISARCLCGAVRFRLVPPTTFASHCHCASCRAAHAAPFVTWTAVAAERFHADAVDALVDYASSPGVRRSFCGRCGTQMRYLATPADGGPPPNDASADVVYVPVAVCDHLDRVVDAHVSYEERAPWLAGVEALPCFHAKGDAPLPWTTQ